MYYDKLSQALNTCPQFRMCCTLVDKSKLRTWSYCDKKKMSSCYFTVPQVSTWIWDESTGYSTQREGAREAPELEGTAMSRGVPGPAPHRQTTDGSRVGITGEDLRNRAPHQEQRARRGEVAKERMRNESWGCNDQKQAGMCCTNWVKTNYTEGRLWTARGSPGPPFMWCSVCRPDVRTEAHRDHQGLKHSKVSQCVYETETLLQDT